LREVGLILLVFLVLPLRLTCPAVSDRLAACVWPTQEVCGHPQQQDCIDHQGGFDYSLVPSLLLISSVSVGDEAFAAFGVWYVVNHSFIDSIYLVDGLQVCI